MAKSRIAIIVGSNRRNSINRKLARALAKLGADKFDASFVRIDDLPMFNQDLEGNLPEEAVRFKSEIANADGVLIVTPEHDRSIPALLKNAVDWELALMERILGLENLVSSLVPHRAQSAARSRNSICALSWSGSG